MNLRNRHHILILSALYLAELRRLATVATHRFSLRLAKSFWLWAVRCGHTAVNPWLNVDAVGRIKVGKPQLRPSEARRFADAAEQEALTGAGLRLPCSWVFVAAYEHPKRLDSDGET